MTETYPVTTSGIVVPYRRPSLVLAMLAAVLVGAILLSAGIGAVGITPGEVIAIVLGSIGLPTQGAYDLRQEHVLLAIRLPRVVMGLFIGRECCRRSRC